MGSDDLPDLSMIALRTDATQSRPYQRLTGPVSPTKRHFRVPGLSPQVSGTGYQVQVRVRGKVQVLNLYPNLNA
jgi:hypothetical protein